MKSLVIGMGIGSMYAGVLKDMGAKVITVDSNPDKNPTYTTIESALNADVYDTAHISTPNFTHYRIARQVANAGTRIVFIDKPGVETAEQWNSLVKEFPGTRFMMVKNNQYRSNIEELKELYQANKEVLFIWQNDNRVPNPGTWFSTKALAFGGVSRDLLPHLISLFVALDNNYSNFNWNESRKYQNWRLEDLLNTDYGIVNPNGTYDVDDRVEIECFSSENKNFKKNTFIADWRSLTGNKIGIDFGNTFIELGLCPEEAYANMFRTAYNRLNDTAFWNEQLTQDLYIIGRL
jgi:predicted dehydrogenase